MIFPEHLSKKLTARKEQDAFRVLTSPNGGIDFCSNDYLGLANNASLYTKAHKRLVESDMQKSGAGGSRLLTGNHELYQEVEALLTKAHHCEAALIYPSGYMANLGLLGAITNRECIMLYDSLSHASIREALGFSKAKSYKFGHNDLNHLEQLIKKYRDSFKEIFVVTESVFSMDGDSPDLQLLTALCTKYGCHCILDEAHAIGVFGNRGQGLAKVAQIEDALFARVVTFGKALGCHGAAVLGSKRLIEFLINFSRPFVYTTGMAPIAVATILEGYNWMLTSEQFVLEQKTLHRNIALLQSSIIKFNLSDYFVLSNSAIHSCIIPGNNRVKEICQKLQSKGFGVLPILAPTVPEGQERIRICLHSHNTEEEICELVKNISRFINY